MQLKADSVGCTVLIGLTLWLGVPLVSREFVLHLFLLHNMTKATFFGSINGSFWSLAVECQIYALYPLALFVRSRFGVRGMLAFGYIASVLWRVGAYIGADLPPSTWTLWYSPIALWPDWLLGAALAESHQDRNRLFKNPIRWAIGSVALFPIASCFGPIRVLGFSLASLTSAALVDAYLASKRSWDLSAIIRPLGLFGVCSYSVYLIHEPLLRPFISVLSGLGVSPVLQISIGFPVFVLLISGVGWVHYSLVEKGRQQIGKSVSVIMQKYRIWGVGPDGRRPNFHRSGFSDGVRPKNGGGRISWRALGRQKL